MEIKITKMYGMKVIDIQCTLRIKRYRKTHRIDLDVFDIPKEVLEKIAMELKETVKGNNNTKWLDFGEHLGDVTLFQEGE